MANNPYKNKVIFDGNTLIDLTGDNVDPNRMLVNTTAHDASGAPIVGNIAVRYSSDMTASEDTVTAPAGYYASPASKRVASGTAGTPTASKGTVTNHSIYVTPSVTNTAGYINGGTTTGSAAIVTAAELVSGTQTIYENGTVNVTNLASVDVSVYPKRTATITRTGKYDLRGGEISAVAYPDTNTVYYTQGDTFEFSPSSTLRIWVELYWSGSITISVDGVVVDSTTATNHTYNYVLPDKDIEIALDSSTTNKNDIEITTVAESSDFIIDLYDNGTAYVPSVTYADAYAAYTDGKTIAFSNQDLLACYGEYIVSDSCFNYYIDFLDNDGHGDSIIRLSYTWNSNGVTLTSQTTLYQTAYATAVPADVASGKTFFAANGFQTGTGSSGVNLQAKTNIAPTTSSQTITADAGYDGLSSVQINAMPSGTAGTPTATKGTVSNHAVTVTPSVTNTTGYINGGTKTGTGVTVTASELVSGSQTITQNGTVNVTNLASVDVQIPFVTYYTGTTDPPASLGNNGDIYLKVVS